jgi:hypothetical protein
VTDGDGPSLVIIDPLGAAANWGNGASWRPSFEIHGSPGAIDRMAGDADGNNRVDFVDVAIVQGALGSASGATWAIGDFNRDGMVNRTDVALLSRNYGRSYTPPAPSPTASASAVVVSRVARRPGELAGSSLVNSLAVAAVRRDNASRNAPRVAAHLDRAVDRAVDAVSTELAANGSADTTTKLRLRRLTRSVGR